MPKPRLSKIESLYSELIDALRAQVKGTKDPETGENVPPPAAVLAVAAKVVAQAGIRPTEDGEIARKVVDLKEALPMVDIDSLTSKF
jgi:hypothetical protein